MEKTIKIGGVDVKLDNNFEWAYIYKDQFGHDIIPDLMPLLHSVATLMGGVVEEKGGLENLSVKDMTNLFKSEAVADALYKLSAFESTDVINLTWALAKTADPDIEEPRRWIRQFDNFYFDEVLPELVGMIADGVVSTKNRQSLRKVMPSPKAKTRKSTSTK